MQNVEEFKLDEWSEELMMACRETAAQPRSEFALQGSYVSALCLDELRSLSTDADLGMLDGKLTLDYGTHEGSLRLRRRIAQLHSSDGAAALAAEHVLVTPGSIMANYLVLGALCGPGDHVICQYPTFAQLFLVPRFNGADVGLWRMREGEGWMPCLDELVRMIRPNTKAIILNNPNNPTGAVLSKEMLLRIDEVARQHDLILFCDEVFSPLFFADEPRPPSVVALGPAGGGSRSIVTGSLSKSFAIPGVRIGWLVTRDEELMRRIRTARVYTTLSVPCCRG
ncbi:hypothetical protein CDD83_3294 [Cordyceps sp. RAO-2017]|nr:hypothetical protein CDD83_3294 [Cordyceps sp. RAO-2017]